MTKDDQGHQPTQAAIGECAKAFGDFFPATLSRDKAAAVLRCAVDHCGYLSAADVVRLTERAERAMAWKATWQENAEMAIKETDTFRYRAETAEKALAERDQLNRHAIDLTRVLEDQRNAAIEERDDLRRQLDAMSIKISSGPSCTIAFICDKCHMPIKETP